MTATSVVELDKLVKVLFQSGRCFRTALYDPEELFFYCSMKTLAEARKTSTTSPDLNRLDLLRTKPIFSARHRDDHRSEEHTSELQSHHDLVCRLLLEKKKNKKTTKTNSKTII